MNFLEYIEDVRKDLRCYNYVDMLWDQVRAKECITFASTEDQEAYTDHLPVDFNYFLNTCLAKLRLIKNGQAAVDMSELNAKYVCTLIYYAIEQEDAVMENRLNAAALYLLLNILNIPNKRLFHEVIYMKILGVLLEYHATLTNTNRILMLVMDDLKLFLGKHHVPNFLLETVAFLCKCSYNNNQCFDTINPDRSNDNLGYAAFLALKILTDKLTQHESRNKTLFILLLGMVQDLMSKATRNYSPNVVLAHQHNVRLFIRENFQKFTTPHCIVTKVLQSILLNSDYDNYNGAACIIEELPILTYEQVYRFVLNSLKSEKSFRVNVFNYIVPLIKHPNQGDSEDQLNLRMKLLLYTFLKAFLSPKPPDVDVVRIIYECSEHTLGIKALIEILRANAGAVNKSTFFELMYSTTDKAWTKKQRNVSYVTLMCNLCLTWPQLFQLKLLNQLRSICISGTPYDLKICIGYYKRILINHSTRFPLVMYFLEFFIKLMLHPQETSSRIAKELFELIFSHITESNNLKFVWDIVRCLFCNSFETDKIFEKFRSLGLIKTYHVEVLLNYKIKHHEHRKPALKLLQALLNHINYNKTTILDEELKSWILNACPDVQDFNVILCSLLKMLERKQYNNCTPHELLSYRPLQFSVYESFGSQMFPVDCIISAIKLLKEYSRLLGEGQEWSQNLFIHYEESLCTKLQLICEMKSVNIAIFMKDVIYTIKFITFGKEKLGEYVLVPLERIIYVSNQSQQFTDYLCSNQEIVRLCIMLYTNICLQNSSLILHCIECLEHISRLPNQTNNLKLQIMLSLYDVCNLHLRYFDPLIPLLFDNILSQSAYLRFYSMNIIIQLINERQLHMVDGQFYSFMGLLSDTNELIIQHTEVFVEEKFVPSNLLSVAKYFVPGIIHYNHFYDHPSITLTEDEQAMLKKKLYTFQNRCCIYYHLYRFLPEKVKFTILKGIALEILTIFTKKTISFSPTLLPILFDALVVVVFTIPNNTKQNDIDLFYSNGFEKIKTELLANATTQQKNFQDYQLIMGTLLVALFNILYSELNQYAEVCQNVLFTIISLTNGFLDLIKRIVTEEDDLKKQYIQLEPFFRKVQPLFAINQVKVNPADFEEILSQKQNCEFYFHETLKWNLISEDVVNTFNRV